jgi:hypothetical protein
MFVGHAAIAFAAVGLGARLLGTSRERALLLATVGAAAAVLPDLDVVYALSGLAAAGSWNPLAIAEGFWAASTVVHRSVTHSIVLAVPTAAGIALVAAGDRLRSLGLGLLLLVGLVGGLSMGPATWVAVSGFLLGAAGLGLAATRLRVGPEAVGLAAAVGLVTHPFGDLFTGQPPLFLYPVDVQLFAERVALAADPTLHLLGAFFIELAAIWLGVYAFFRLRDRAIAPHISPRAVLGGGYALAALVLPAPTLDVSYHFVFSVTAVGIVGAMPHRGRIGHATRAVTGLAAVTLAGVAYAVSYLVLGL